MVEKQQCCGCEACKAVCGVGAISMEQDNTGFLYPVVDADKCVNCGRCSAVCPCEQDIPYDAQPHFQKAYAGYMTDAEALMHVASGGAATALAHQFLKQDHHYVYGVRYAEDFKSAYFCEIDDPKQLHLLSDSKYIQSEKHDIYKQVQKRLLEGASVFFVGLPCDIVALKMFLGKEYEKLITADLICYGPTAPAIQAEYVTHLEKQLKGKIIEFSVRNKSAGWENASLYAKSESGHVLCIERSTTEFGIAFTKYARQACTQCCFKGEHRMSDITLGDYWGVDKASDIYNKNGVSLIFVHTEKGNSFIETIEGYRSEPVDLDRARKYNLSIDISQNPVEEREKFASAYASKGLFRTVRDWKYYIKKYVPKEKIDVLKKWIRKGKTTK